MEKKKEGDLDHDSYFYVQLRLMQIWGLWPYKSKSKFITYAHYIYSRSLMICLFIISCQQLLQMTISPDLENISAAIDVASLALAALFRQALFALYIKDFKNLVDKVETNFLPHRMPYTVRFDMKEWLSRANLYTGIYNFSPFVIIIVWVTSRNIDNIKIIQELEKTSLLQDFDNTTVFEKLALNLSSLINDVSKDDNVDLGKTSTKRRLPINCWYPYDSGISPMFEFAFAWETTMAAVCGVAYTISDSFLFMLIYLVCGQLEILKTSLLLLEEDYEKYKKIVAKTMYINKENNGKMSPVPWEAYSREREIQSKMNEAIIKCIDFHTEIIDIIRQLDMMLRSMIVVDFLHAVISLSFAMLQTIIANTIYEWVQMILFIGVCILHQFLNNYFCEILIQQQVTVAEAAYNTPWVEGSDTFKTAVFMTMVQSRCPTLLSGWKMYVLGLSTFVEFMKLLASYFLVLQSLHAEETSEKK